MSGIDWSNGKHDFLVAGDARLEFVCFGELEKNLPVIILLHEGLGCCALWRDFPSKLSELTGLPVFAYSRAGYGKSDPKPLPWSLDYMTSEAELVLPLILGQIPVEQFLLLGHSDGATIAAIYAGSCDDDRIAGLIVMAPHFYAEDDGLASIDEARIAYQTTDLRSKLGRYHTNPDNAFLGWNDSWLHPDFRKWNVAHVVSEIHCPVLAIQGVADQYGSEEQVQLIGRTLGARAKVALLEDCQHSPHLEQSETVLALINEFVDEKVLGPTLAAKSE